MRKISGNLFMAIDGVVESPKQWSLSYWNDNIANVVMGGNAGRGRAAAPPALEKVDQDVSRHSENPAVLIQTARLLNLVDLGLVDHSASSASQ